MTVQAENCAICGEGHLDARVDKNPVDYKGQTAVLNAHYSVCDACGSEQTNAAQARLNKRAMLAFKKRVDGLLTGTEVRALRERLGINQAEAAEIFGGGPVAFSKYENDDVMQSEAMDKLLRVAGSVPGALDYLRQHVAGETAAKHWMRIELEEKPLTRPRLRVISSSVPESEPSWRKSA